MIASLLLILSDPASTAARDAMQREAKTTNQIIPQSDEMLDQAGPADEMDADEHIKIVNSFTLSAAALVTSSRWFECITGFANELALTAEPINSIVFTAQAECRVKEWLARMDAQQLAHTEEFRGHIGWPDILKAIDGIRTDASDSAAHAIVAKRYRDAFIRWKNKHSD